MRRSDAIVGVMVERHGVFFKLASHVSPDSDQIDTARTVVSRLW